MSTFLGLEVKEEREKGSKHYNDDKETLPIWVHIVCSYFLRSF